MLIANEIATEHRGFRVIAVPMQTVWGCRVERLDGTLLMSRPNGSLDSTGAIAMGREFVDQLPTAE